MEMYFNNGDVLLNFYERKPFDLSFYTNGVEKHMATNLRIYKSGHYKIEKNFFDIGYVVISDGKGKRVHNIMNYKLNFLRFYKQNLNLFYSQRITKELFGDYL